SINRERFPACSAPSRSTDIQGASDLITQVNALPTFSVARRLVPDAGALTSRNYDGVSESGKVRFSSGSARQVAQGVAGNPTGRMRFAGGSSARDHFAVRGRCFF